MAYLRSSNAGDVTRPWPPSSALSHRNMLINGAMNIDQRNSGSAVTISPNAYTLDRWKGLEDSGGAYTVQQVAEAPADFKNSLKVTVTSDSGSYGSSQYATIQYAMEGQDMAHLNWGTSDAKTVTLSFWVKSSLTGTFGGSIENSAQNRSYPYSYTISSAATWEKKTITLAGDTSGTWTTTSGVGCYIFISLGQGSTYSGTAGSWAAATYLGNSGAVQVLDTNGATWQITGVQLELGSVATPFEHRSYGYELRRCQRYFEWLSMYIGQSNSTSATDGSAGFKVDKRITSYSVALTNTGSMMAHPHIVAITPTSMSATQKHNSGCYMTINGGTHTATKIVTFYHGHGTSIQIIDEL